jgi:hypothetical protein
MRAASTILFLLTIAACGGGGGGGPILGGSDASITPFPDQAFGGIWTGTDSNGLEILALTTETGRLHWVAQDTGEQGYGTGSVSALSATIDYTYVAPLGFTLADGSASASCRGGGTVEERVSLYVDAICTTASGSTFNNTATLAYDALYDRDSSLALIAGNYDDFGLVVNVSGDGVVFEQDPNTGCVVNGQISVIDAEFNAYDVSITYSNCLGNTAILNGATFTGLGTLDNSAAPETAVVGLTGDIQGVTYAVLYALSRI